MLLVLEGSGAAPRGQRGTKGAPPCPVCRTCPAHSPCPPARPLPHPPPRPQLFEAAEAKAYYGLCAHYGALTALVQALEEREALTGDQLTELLSSHGALGWTEGAALRCTARCHRTMPTKAPAPSPGAPVAAPYATPACRRQEVQRDRVRRLWLGRRRLAQLARQGGELVGLGAGGRRARAPARLARPPPPRPAAPVPARSSSPPPPQADNAQDVAVELQAFVAKHPPASPTAAAAAGNGKGVAGRAGNGVPSWWAPNNFYSVRTDIADILSESMPADGLGEAAPADAARHN